MDPRILDQTKLLIWDLDGTFWDGVLSEEGAVFRKDMLERVVLSCRHGIVSSIASNNDLSDVRRLLKAHRAQRYFVFPNVHWGSKPEMVRSILESTKLRPQSALFLDDKARIRESVRSAVPDLLATATADEFAGAFEQWSKQRAFSDAKLERLKRYQLLERKQAAFHAARKPERPTADSARDFLRSSGIRCALLPISAELKPRVLELIARTNQLNFTKRRIGPAALDALLTDSRFECRAVEVKDRFGDYGVCGFYALRSAPRPRLQHFLFSCRILGMGVEEALYARLGSPELALHADQRELFARVKARAPSADWIDFGKARARKDSKAARVQPIERWLTLIGPCEMLGLIDVLPARIKQAFAVDSRVTFVDSAGRNIAHFGHHSLLELALDPAVASRYQQALAKIPWFDRSLIDPGFLKRREPQVLVISSARSAQCADYVHRSGAFSVPIDYFRLGGRDVTEQSNWPWLEALLEMQGGCPKGFTRWFAREFEFGGPVSAQSYRATLDRLIRRLPPESRLVLLNVADIDQVTIAAPDQSGRRLVSAWKRQHQRVNSAIAELARAHADRVAVLDVNRHLRGPDDFVAQPLPPAAALEWALRSFNDFYHFQRRVTVALGRDLADVLRQPKAPAKTQAPRVKVLERDDFRRLMLKFLRLLDRPGGEAAALGLLGKLREARRLPASSDPLRRPTIFYPGLTSQPVWDARQFSWFERVRRAVPRMRAEYQRLRQARSGFRVIFPGPKREGDWAAAWLWLYGREIAENIQRCPSTMKALSGVTRAGWGGFSAMRPGSHVEPHCGSTNAKLRVHVPLVVPPGCRMRVGERMVDWREGEPVVFDDSYEHEVWTTKGEPRCVLMFDIMHPELSEQEATMMDRLDLFFAREYVMKLMRDGEGKTMPWLFASRRKTP